MLSPILMKAKPMLIAAIAAAALGTALTSCATPVPVNKPCGVISDSLKDVMATTADGNRRISDHYEGGRRAGCWK